MKSPFPGMDPYLEPHWRDVHAKLVTYISDALSLQLPNDLAARTEERIYVHSKEAAKGFREYYPDVRVVRTKPQDWVVMEPAGGTAVAEPILVRLRDEPMTETFVQIIDLDTEDVVTVIEVLSTTNKESGDGSKKYRSKQKELKRAKIGLVEIDLIRGGKWVIRTPETIRQKYPSTYRACVTRGWDQRNVFYYPIRIQDPLPPIRIPLRKTDEQVLLEVQPLIDQAYKNGRYASIDYREELDPPLKGDEGKWADELLKAAGKR